MSAPDFFCEHSTTSLDWSCDTCDAQRFAREHPPIYWPLVVEPVSAPGVSRPSVAARLTDLLGTAALVFGLPSFGVAVGCLLVARALWRRAKK